MNDLVQVSAEEADWYRHPITSDERAGLRLAAEVIISAVEDYRTLSRHGQIVAGKVSPACLVSANDRRIKSPWMKYFYEREIEELIEFFHSDQLERWLEYARFKVTANRIREQLGIKMKFAL